MTEDDLSPERFTPEALRWATPGSSAEEPDGWGWSGAVTREESNPALEAIVAAGPSCSDPIPEAPKPEILEEPGVWLVPRPLPRGTIVLANPVPSGRRDSPTTPAPGSPISSWAGGAFSSRLMNPGEDRGGVRLRRSSLWTTPERLQRAVGPPSRPGGAPRWQPSSRCGGAGGDAGEPPPGKRRWGGRGAMVNGWGFNFQESTQCGPNRWPTGPGAPDDWLTRTWTGASR